jgi:hypothetical protein
MGCVEENWLWYLAGTADTAMNLSVNVNKDNRLKINYAITPVLTLSRPKEALEIFNLLEDYAKEQDVKYRFETSSSTDVFRVDNPESIRNFLEPIAPGFIQQQEKVEMMLEDFLPLFEDGRPTDEDEFLEAMEIADEMRRLPIEGRSGKYTAGYFYDEWRR